MGGAEHEPDRSRTERTPVPGTPTGGGVRMPPSHRAALLLQRTAGNRAATTALQRVDEPPTSSPDLSALDDAALAAERNRTLTALRALPEDAPDRAALTAHARAVERVIASRTPAPTVGELQQIILHNRAFGAQGATPTREARTPQIDPRGIGQRNIGTGYEVHAAILVTDAQGRQVAVAVRDYSRGSQPHAEAQAITSLSEQLTAGSIRGGQVTVVVDQDPCPDCTRRIEELAQRIGAARVEVHVPSRPARGGRLAAPRTAARGWTQGSTPQITRAVPTPRLLWDRTYQVPPVPVAPAASGTGAMSAATAPSTSEPMASGVPAAPASEVPAASIPTAPATEPATSERVRVDVPPEPAASYRPQPGDRVRVNVDPEPTASYRPQPGDRVRVSVDPEPAAPYRPQPGDRVRVSTGPEPAAPQPEYEELELPAGRPERPRLSTRAGAPASGPPPADPRPWTPARPPEPAPRSGPAGPATEPAATPYRPQPGDRVRVSVDPEPPVGGEPAPSRGTRGGGRGGSGGGILSFVTGMLYQWAHSGVVEQRRDREGYVPSGPLQHQGTLDAMGHWLMDPTMDSQTPSSARLNVRVWRQRTAAAAAAARGEFRMIYQVHTRGAVGFQRVQDLEVVYRRGPGDRWTVGSSQLPPDIPVPDLNRIIDLAGVSDADVEAMLTVHGDMA